MAGNTVSTNTIFSGINQQCIQLIGLGTDTSDESAVKKLDISTLTASKGSAPKNITYLWMEWSIQGFTSVTILADHNSSDVVVARLGNSGYKDWTDIGGFQADIGTGPGDILLTTIGAIANATYDITICVKLDA